MTNQENDFMKIRRTQLEGEMLGVLLALNHQIEDALVALRHSIDATLELRDLIYTLEDLPDTDNA